MKLDAQKLAAQHLRCQPPHALSSEEQRGPRAESELELALAKLVTTIPERGSSLADAPAWAVALSAQLSAVREEIAALRCRIEGR